MRFENRDEAARLLLERLAPLNGLQPVVLGLPRGGVPMARLIADGLGGDVDVALVRKLRAPDQPELAVGAIDEDGTVLEGPHFRGVPEPYLREEIRVQQKILRDRRERYTRQRPAVPLEGRLVVIVDDGVATGASMLAAVRAVRARKPAGLVVAIGVAPPASVRALEAEADEVVCLYAPTYFEAVGQFYDDFSEVTDEMVVAALAPPPGSAVRP